jgi:hypothetical protein
MQRLPPVGNNNCGMLCLFYVGTIWHWLALFGAYNINVITICIMKSTGCIAPKPQGASTHTQASEDTLRE